MNREIFSCDVYSMKILVSWLTNDASVLAAFEHALLQYFPLLPLVGKKGLWHSWQILSLFWAACCSSGVTCFVISILSPFPLAAARRLMYPLQVFLREMLVQQDPSQVAMQGDTTTSDMEKYRSLLQYCTIMVATVPILAIYPFMQRYFVTGVMLGSVKG